MVNANRPTSYEKLSYSQKLSRANRKMRRGDVTRVSENTGFSPNYVSEVLSGLYSNDRVINEAYDLSRGRISNINKISAILVA